MADNVTGNGLHSAAFQFRKPAAGSLSPGFFDLRINASVQRGGETIYDFRHLLARQMDRFFDDLIQCHRHDSKLRLVTFRRNGESTVPATGPRFGEGNYSLPCRVPQRVQHERGNDNVLCFCLCAG